MFSTFGSKKREPVTTTASSELLKRFDKSGHKRSYALAIGMKTLLNEEIVLGQNSKMDELEKKISKLASLTSRLNAELWTYREEKNDVSNEKDLG